MAELTDDLCAYIFHSLEMRDLVCAAGVCRAWRAVATRDPLVGMRELSMHVVFPRLRWEASADWRALGEAWSARVDVLRIHAMQLVLGGRWRQDAPECVENLTVFPRIHTLGVVSRNPDSGDDMLTMLRLARPNHIAGNSAPGVGKCILASAAACPRLRTVAVDRGADLALVDIVQLVNLCGRRLHALMLFGTDALCERDRIAAFRAVCGEAHVLELLVCADTPEHHVRRAANEMESVAGFRYTGPQEICIRFKTPHPQTPLVVPATYPPPPPPPPPPNACHVQ